MPILVEGKSLTLMANQWIRQLRRLAALHKVQTSYIDMHGDRCFASPEALFAVLQSLDESLVSHGDIAEAILVRRAQVIGEWVPPVLVASDGNPECVTIRVPLEFLPTHAVGPRLQYTLHLENGDIWSGNVRIENKRTLRHVRAGDRVSVVKAFLPQESIPFGYHTLTVLIGSRAFQSLVIAAPTLSFQPAESSQHEWGIFAPTYALKSARNWGVGDFTDAGALASWAGEHGGSVLGTLPFLASYLDRPCDPSPYTPNSRLFWNELFVDVTRIPELSHCRPAQDIIGSDHFQSQLRSRRDERLVDYAGVMSLKRQALFSLSRHLNDTRGRRFDAFREFITRSPEVSAYAQFRATTTAKQTVWTEWASPRGDGAPVESGFEQSEEFYHLYCQFVASEQVEGLTKRCDTEGVTLYLDYPLGVHAEGFDTWRYPSLFARGVTVGAPPDPVFTTGQDWGFHPIIPAAQRREGYRYFIASLRHHMRHAGMLRLDHVMGLHRLYWIPKGFRKSDGVYVRYPNEEIYAILTLESHRSQTVLIGENLGIVPGYIDQSMRRHGLSGMNVAYWEIASDPDGALQRMAERPAAIASLNTHDTFPFAAFWNALDADKRHELGMITSEQASLERWVRGELRSRVTKYLREHGHEITGENDTVAALRGMLLLLAQSDARWLLITLEDLWLETSPQNIPDTVTEHPNWRQKTKMSLEELVHDKGIDALLKIVNEARGRSASAGRA